MTQEPYQPVETTPVQQNPYATRAQQRHERHMAKQAARAARRLEHSHRPHQDWTFEVKIGENAYTFSWRWHNPAEVFNPTQPAPGSETSPLVPGELDLDL